MNVSKHLTIAIFFWATGASAQEWHSQLKNNNKEGECLTVAQDKTNLSFVTCNGGEEQKWVITYDSSSYYRIGNASIPNKCLRTLSNGSGVQLGDCSGDGYSSMRLWAINYRENNNISLKNKYTNDLGRSTQTLNAVANKVGMSNAADINVSLWSYNGDIPLANSPTVGKKKVLLMATHFNNTMPANPEPIRKAVFGDGDDYSSLQHYLRQGSRAALLIDGTFLSNVNIGDRPMTCDHNAILSASKNAALKQGVNPADYDYLFVDISRTSECRFEGLAALQGNWIITNGVGYKYWVWTHEFGHNLGYTHPNTLRDCPINDSGIVQINGQCSIQGGDDMTDTMGGGGGKLYPITYQLFSNWIPDSNMSTIHKSGLYELTTLWQGLQPGMIESYRIPRPDGSILALEYRQPQPSYGFDNFEYDTPSPFISGVTVRLAKYSGKTVTSTLVDATPGSKLGMKDAPLMPGQSLYDELSDTLITVVAIDSSGATILVEKNVSMSHPE